MMVKLLSGKKLHTTQDSIPQSPLAEAREDEISSISAKRRSSDKHTYYIFFMPLCMLITVLASWHLSVSAQRHKMRLKFDLLDLNICVWGAQQ